MGSMRGLKSVVICVLLLGIVLEQVQVEGQSCCKDTTARNCFNRCRLAPSFCADECDCIITEYECPPEYPELPSLSGAGTPYAIDFCSMGCMSSICDHINSVYRGEEKEIDMKLCGSACASFCNKIATMAPVEA